MNKNLKLVVNNSFKKIENKNFFEKKELKTILDLYAKMVSEGSWKDYGLSIANGQVGFSVFKNAAENAKYRSTKIYICRYGMDMEKCKDLEIHKIQQNINIVTAQI